MGDGKYLSEDISYKIIITKFLLNWLEVNTVTTHQVFIKVNICSAVSAETMQIIRMPEAQISTVLNI